ncbi:MAG: hypothetical protein U0793_27150 [Gemmataceae bacterium]
MAFQDSCPACGESVHWHHLAASPLAPFYFRCKHCQAALRLRDFGAAVVVYAIILVAAGVVAGGSIVVSRLAPTVSRTVILIVVAGVVVIPAVVAILVFLFQGGRIAARQPGTDAERSYALTVWLGLVLCTLLAIVMGVATGIYMELF